MSSEENKNRDEQLQQELPEQEAFREGIASDDVAIEKNEGTEGLEPDEKELQIAHLEAELLLSEARLREQRDFLLRAKAESENIRRRSEQEIDKARKYALSRFSEELLPVIDNLERAIQSAGLDRKAMEPIIEGVEITYKLFIDTITRFGLKSISPEIGGVFNPEYHQAMSIEESSGQKTNIIMRVMQKGYELNGRVIRPAMVIVSK